MKATKIIVSLCMTIFLGGCSLFDITPKTDIEADDMFSDDIGFQSALVGVYVLMTHSDLYSNNLTFNYVEKLAQRYDNYPNIIPTDEDRAKIYDYKTNESSKSINNAIWSRGYNVIVNANNIIKWLDIKGMEAIGSQKSIDMYRGEALAQRAYMHFDLLRYWGPIYNSTDSTKRTIPYRKTVSKDPAPTIPANQVMDNIVNDLVESIGYLKDNDSDKRTRFTEYGVKALLARVLLYRGDLEGAFKYANDVVLNSENKLVNNIQDDAAMKNETLFGLSYYQLNDYISKYFANTTALTDQLFISDQNHEDVFEFSSTGQNDIRATEGSGFFFLRENSAKMLRKYVTTSAVYKDFIPLIKLSEMYYILAETTPNNDSHIYVNKVRNARGISKSENYGDLSDHVQLMEALNKEYQKDFFGEGQYFPFLKRHAYTDFHRNPIADGFYLNNYIFPLPDNEVEFGWTE